jgi:hypothetical protein
MVVWGYALALVAGISFVFQQAVNANLRVELSSAWWAGFVSYLGGNDCHARGRVGSSRAGGLVIGDYPGPLVIVGRWHFRCDL